MHKSYYDAYEDRYKKVYKAGIRLWGNSRDDSELVNVLTDWVRTNNLVGKKIVEFACGEGEIAVILSELGCHYKGFDIAPTAVEKTSAKLSKFPHSSVECKDLVKDTIDGEYDALLDVMGLHMIVMDEDRRRYLSNGFNCLKENSPFLFYRQNSKENSYEGIIDDIGQYAKMHDCDYVTPGKREVVQDGKKMEVYIPLVPARSRSLEGYRKEFTKIGFIVDEVFALSPNRQTDSSAAIYGHKD